MLWHVNEVFLNHVWMNASIYSATLYRHKKLYSKEEESGFLCSRRGINITRTRHTITYNVPCRLVINWPAMELLTFVHCIYQQRRSRNWSVFLSPDRVTKEGLSHRTNYPIRFVHIITGSILSTLRNVAVQLKCLWWLCQSDVYYSKYRLLTALRLRKKHICRLRFCESTEQGPENNREMFVRNILLTEQQIKYWKCSVHLFCFHATAIKS